MGSKHDNTRQILPSLKDSPTDAAILEGVHTAVLQDPKVSPEDDVSIPFRFRFTSTCKLPDVTSRSPIQLLKHFIPLVPELLQRYDLRVHIKDGLCNPARSAEKIVGVVHIPGQESCSLTAVLSRGRGRGRWRRRRVTTNFHAPALFTVNFFTSACLSTHTCQAVASIHVVTHLIGLPIWTPAGTTPTANLRFPQILCLVIPVLVIQLELEIGLLPCPRSFLQQEPRLPDSSCAVSFGGDLEQPTGEQKQQRKHGCKDLCTLTLPQGINSPMNRATA
mmetsp:Transcript_53733/g.100700  ORF Transcript_53733/g.100700 Transcript_53733/m.100700 type:complete len:277 (-) Transcript_53733:1-831(-)